MEREEEYEMFFRDINQDGYRKTMRKVDADIYVLRLVAFQGALCEEVLASWYFRDRVDAMAKAIAVRNWREPLVVSQGSIYDRHEIDPTWERYANSELVVKVERIKMWEGSPINGFRVPGDKGILRAEIALQYNEMGYETEPEYLAELEVFNELLG
tara:strand:- start:1438 stop:1905 length:468 start_codon:yes stop_codon:yes gene_type:complete